MGNFFNRVKNVLSNENAGPNVEQLIGIGISVIIIVALMIFAKEAFQFAYDASEIVLFYQDA